MKVVPVFLMTSGARYSGVPQRVYVSPVPSESANQFSLKTPIPPFLLSTSRPPLLPQLLQKNHKGKKKNEELTILHPLRKPKIHQLQMPLRINQNILRLQIPIRNPFLLMQKLEYQYNLRGIELRRWFVEAAGAAEVAEDFAAGAVVELRTIIQPLAKPIHSLFSLPE